MITMNELVDLRMQQHIAHEIYRQQVMQRIPDPFPPLLPIPMPRHVIIPPRESLPNVEATLQNRELWKEFHKIGTEMIITKSGRRMFPSMRLALSGLEDDANYCVLLEMIPIGDCRYKFSGSQWVPAGGAEPQSPQRMFLHPDSPATGAHWQTQPILFNKVKLTNNTLDNNGHIVLASMHKYQPRLHVIRTSDLTQIPWAPQKSFVFSEMEFVAVTAYQNDRITKLKIDNNPFAKGFRETGQSRCKRKMSSSPPPIDDRKDKQVDQPYDHQQQPESSLPHANNMSPTFKYGTTPFTPFSTCSGDDDKITPNYHQQQHQPNRSDDDDCHQIKRLKSNDSACSASSFDESMAVVANVDFNSSQSTTNSSGTNTVNVRTMEATTTLSTTDTATKSNSPPSSSPPCPAAVSQPKISNSCDNQPRRNTSEHTISSTTHAPSSPPVRPSPSTSAFIQHFQQNVQTLLRPSLVDLACSYVGRLYPMYPPSLTLPSSMLAATTLLPPPPPLPPTLPPQSPPMSLPADTLLTVPGDRVILCNNGQQQQQQQQQFRENLTQNPTGDFGRVIADNAVAMTDPSIIFNMPGSVLPPIPNVARSFHHNYHRQQQQQEFSSKTVSSHQNQSPPPQKKTKNFSISAILDHNS